MLLFHIILSTYQFLHHCIILYLFFFNENVKIIEKRHFPGEEKRHFPGEEHDEYKRFYPGGMPPSKCMTQLVGQDQ